NVGNQNGHIVVLGIAAPNVNHIRNGDVVVAQAKGNGNGNMAKGEGMLLIFRLRDIKDIEEFNANCILMANLQQASTSGTQTDKALVYDSDRSAENDSNVISAVSSVEQGRGTVEHHPINVEETGAYFESLYNNLAIKVEKVNSVNRKMKETNVDLTTELARYKNQEKHFEISQENMKNLKDVIKSLFIKNNVLLKR
ncbi:hypothetical protein Tco_0119250, partial [Tanacetum coccineum]